MLAKRTSKNQVTLPKAIVQTAGQADVVRVKLEKLGLTQDDVSEAVANARLAKVQADTHRA
jgi:predicted negative regulator of RcsB-dependent stress response